MDTLTYDGTWQELGTGATALIVSSSNTAALYIGDVAPSASDRGFKIKDDYPYSVGNLGDFGGGAWVRGNDGVCDYAIA